MIALALAAVFASSLGAGLAASELALSRARTSRDMVDAFAKHQSDFEGMAPGEGRSREYASQRLGSAPVRMIARAKLYGNDMIETDIEASAGGQELAFEALRAREPVDDRIGTPLCSVEHEGAIEIAPIILPIAPSISLTGIAVRDGIAYISADPSRASDPDLFVVDIRVSAHPVALSQIDTGPGLAGLAVAGEYVYGAASSAAAQLHVIRMHSLSSPELVARYRLPAPDASTTLPRALSIFYENGVVYLGTEAWKGGEVAAIDVAEPASPHEASEAEIGSGVAAVYALDGVAYAASSGREELTTIDVSDPVHPRMLGIYSPTGWERQTGRALAAFEGDIALGRTSGGFDILSDPELLVGSSSRSSFSPVASLDIPGGAYGMVLDKSHAFVAARDADRELYVVDRSLATSSASYYSLPVPPQAMACDGDRLYILARGAPAVYEISFHP